MDNTKDVSFVKNFNVQSFSISYFNIHPHQRLIFISIKKQITTDFKICTNVFFRKHGNRVPKNKLQAVCGLRYAKIYFLCRHIL